MTIADFSDYTDLSVIWEAEIPSKRIAEGSCCESDEGCRVEAVVSIDARGQIVLPKEVREGLGLIGGDKLALVTLTQNGKPCCLMVMRAEKLARSARDFLGPILSEK